MEIQSTQIYGIIVAALLFLISFGVLTYVLVRVYRKNSNIIAESDDIQGMSEQHNCPKCSGMMERGFALAGKGIIYQEESGTISTFSTVAKVLDNTMSFSLPTTQNRAWYCKNCKYILIDHSKLIKRRKKNR